MPDVAMCLGLHCDRHSNCWRFMAEPSAEQSYMMLDPDEQGPACHHYWPMRVELPPLEDADGA